MNAWTPVAGERVAHRSSGRVGTVVSVDVEDGAPWCVNLRWRDDDDVSHVAPASIMPLGLAVGTVEAMPVVDEPHIPGVGAVSDIVAMYVPEGPFVIGAPCAHCGERGCTDMHPEPGDLAALAALEVQVVQVQRFTVGQIVLVTLRWTEERGRGRPANELQQVRLGTIHGADNNAPRLSVEVPGCGVVVAERRDVEDAGVGCR